MKKRRPAGVGKEEGGGHEWLRDAGPLLSAIPLEHETRSQRGHVNIETG